jgi:hypothetical protein
MDLTLDQLSGADHPADEAQRMLCFFPDLSRAEMPSMKMKSQFLIGSISTGFAPEDPGGPQAQKTWFVILIL